MRSLARCSILVALVATLVACSSGAGGDDTTPPPPPGADTTPPTLPGDVTVTVLSPTQIRVSWTASTDTGGTGVAGYRIHRDGGATALATVTGTNYTDNDVVAGGTSTPIRCAHSTARLPPTSRH